MKKLHFSFEISVCNLALFCRKIVSLTSLKIFKTQGKCLRLAFRQAFSYRIERIMENEICIKDENQKMAHVTGHFCMENIFPKKDAIGFISHSVKYYKII